MGLGRYWTRLGKAGRGVVRRLGGMGRDGARRDEEEMVRAVHHKWAAPLEVRGRPRRPTGSLRLFWELQDWLEMFHTTLAPIIHRPLPHPRPPVTHHLLPGHPPTHPSASYHCPLVRHLLIPGRPRYTAPLMPSPLPFTVPLFRYSISRFLIVPPSCPELLLPLYPFSFSLPRSLLSILVFGRRMITSSLTPQKTTP
ncbi:hypothetical protein E2C01_062751 [Portunus trituberculatus]|uniref:Uncharacterized protein n=1 Tax=Portunus trituberculatus TaxID=210409 RepID=A0A5B7HFR4_PORTR|nr:hypothetical protein [Portunus trituberculatus]